MYIEVTTRQESTTYVNGFEFQFRPTSNVSKLNPKKSFCETNLGQNYLLWNAQFQRRRRRVFSEKKISSLWRVKLSSLLLCIFRWINIRQKSLCCLGSHISSTFCKTDKNRPWFNIWITLSKNFSNALKRQFIQL